jgi:hypothetical protein
MTRQPTATHAGLAPDKGVSPSPKGSARLLGEVDSAVAEGLRLRSVAYDYHVGPSTIVRALERTGSITCCRGVPGAGA